MASERQIAANRANAKRSTGPKTAAGKQKSSRNAFRHGLSRQGSGAVPSADEPPILAAVLAGEHASPERMVAAEEFSSAQAQMARIEAIRAEHWASIDLNRSLEANVKPLKQLAALDRYERYALTKRSQASKRLN